MHEAAPSPSSGMPRKSSFPYLAEATGDVIFGLFFAGVCEDFHGWSELDEFAEIKERGEVGNATGLLHVVRDDYDCVLRLERLDQFLDFRGGNRVQRRAGLVHQYHLRSDGEGACDTQTL